MSTEQESSGVDDVKIISQESEASEADFTRDVGPKNLHEAFQAYVDKVRGGSVGALPGRAGPGAAADHLQPGQPVLPDDGQPGQPAAQGAPFVIFAMGLIFVLLIGEIDLSAGTAGGTCAAMMALALRAARTSRRRSATARSSRC